MSSSVTLYSTHPKPLAESIRQGQTHYAQLAFIREKYGPEVAPIFLSAYLWFTQHAQSLVSKPAQAESPIWAYYDLRTIEQHPNYDIFALKVPLDHVIFFSMADWNHVLNRRFLALTEKDATDFANQLTQQGINYEGDLFNKPFYPQLKQAVIKSWQPLFRHHQSVIESITKGEKPPINDLQAALWQIPKKWITATLT